MYINIKRLHPNAVIPVKKREGDFCYDCVAVSEEEIAPNVWRYGLGIAIQPASENDGQTIRGVSLRPRSSIYETGMLLSNAPGTDDVEENTGELKVIFYHLMPNLPRYKVGDKVCQMCLEKTVPMEFREVSELCKTDRGDRGFGSSGLTLNDHGKE